MLMDVSPPVRGLRSQLLFREVNDRIRDVRFTADEHGFFEALCECGSSACTASVSIRVGDYEEVRAHARRFVVVSGHTDPAIEDIVSDNGRFAVVEAREPRTPR